MKKVKITVLILAALLVFTTSGCVSVNFGWGRNIITGRGPVTSCTYPVSDFSSVIINGSFEIIYKNESSCEVTIEMQENLFDYAEVYAERGTLTVEFLEIVNTSLARTPKLYISAPSLEKLDLAGSVTIKEADKIVAGSLEINVGGACEAKLKLDVTDLKIYIAGAGEMTLSGNAEKASVRIAGAGSVDALELKTVNAGIRMDGAGSGSISCSGMLDVGISGVGSFRYKGDPVVTSDISGLGSLKRVE